MTYATKDSRRSEIMDNYRFGIEVNTHRSKYENENKNSSEQQNNCIRWMVMKLMRKRETDAE